jgi:hypothetical protein
MTDVLKELEKIFGVPDKPKKPESGMTTEELIKNMEHNAKFLGKEKQ